MLYTFFLTNTKIQNDYIIMYLIEVNDYIIGYMKGF